jgi:hypothetical protein
MGHVAQGAEWRSLSQIRKKAEHRNPNPESDLVELQDELSAAIPFGFDSRYSCGWRYPHKYGTENVLRRGNPVDLIFSFDRSNPNPP